MVIRRFAEFLRNSIASARIGLFSRKNSSNEPPPEFRKKRGKALSRARVETVVVVEMARQGGMGGMPKPLGHHVGHHVPMVVLGGAGMW